MNHLFLSEAQFKNYALLNRHKNNLNKASCFLITGAFLMSLIALLGYLFLFLSPIGCIVCVFGAIVLTCLTVSTVFISYYLSRRIKLFLEGITNVFEEEHLKVVSENKNELEKLIFDFRKAQQKSGFLESKVDIPPLSLKERKSLEIFFGIENPLTALVKKGIALPKNKAIKICIMRELAPLLLGSSIFGNKEHIAPFLNWFKKIFKYYPVNIFQFLFEMELDDFPENKALFPGENGCQIVLILFFLITKFSHTYRNIFDETLKVYSDPIQETIDMVAFDLPVDFKNFLQQESLPSLLLIIRFMNFYLLGGMTPLEIERIKRMLESEFLKIRMSLGEDLPQVEQFFNLCIERKFFLPLIFMRFSEQQCFKSLYNFGIEQFFQRGTDPIFLMYGGSEIEESYQVLLKIVQKIGTIKAGSLLQKAMLIPKIKKLEAIKGELEVFFCDYQEQICNPILYLAVLCSCPELQDFIRLFLQLDKEDVPIFEQAISRFIKGMFHDVLMRENGLQFLSQKIGASNTEIYNSIINGTFVSERLSRIFRKPN